MTTLEEKELIIINDLILPIILFLIGLSLIIMNAIYFKNIKIIRLGRSKIVVENDDDEVTYEWTDIDSIGRIPFVMPPAFYLKTKSDNRLVIFNSEGFRNFIHIGSFSLTYDMSDMGVIIRNKKKELDI